jgi:DNA-binding winged helix-turn-helix (wHTH) protein
VAGPGDPPHVVRFGDFAFDSRSLELRKGADIVRLQEQPARALALLLDRAGDLVTREELCGTLWPAGTFVDFDNSLNNTISRLRAALGDNADRPRFVATVGRRGYRFVAPVQGNKAARVSVDELQRERRVGGAATLRARWVAFAAGVAIAIISAALIVAARRNGDPPRSDARAGSGTAAAAARPSANASAAHESEPDVARGPEVVLLEVTMLTEKGRLEEAYRRLRRARAELPSSPHLSFAEMYVLTYAGYLDEAAWAVDETVAQDARYFARFEYTPTVLLYQRRWNQFLTLLSDADSPTVRFYRALTDVERGRRGGLPGDLGNLFARNPEHLFARLGLAMGAALAGRQAEARTALDALARDRPAFNDHDGEVTFKQSQILALAALPDAGLATLEQAVAQGFVCESCFEHSTLLGEVRKRPGYKAILERARQRHDDFGRACQPRRVTRLIVRSTGMPTCDVVSSPFSCRVVAPAS